MLTIETENSDIDVDKLIQHICEEVKKLAAAVPLLIFCENRFYTRSSSSLIYYHLEQSGYVL